MTGSWKTILEHEGVEIEICLKSIGGEEGVLRIFSGHTDKAMKKLANVR